jgi:type IV pilus assembly protein PilA
VTNKTPRGFTLIEMMFVIVIVVILAALAVSAYQTFTVRAQVAEGLNVAAAAKAPVLNAYLSGGVAPPSRVAAGMTPPASDTRGSFVSGVDIVDGRIDVTFGGPMAHQDLVGTKLSLTPYEKDDKQFYWRCGNALAPPGRLLNGGASHLAPSVDARYLPSACRP